MLGLGSTGLAAFAFLTARGATVLGWDEDPPLRRNAPEGLKISNPEDTDWQKVSGLIKSPAVPEDHPILRAALGAGVPLMSDIDMLQKEAPDATYIAVTGTSGKSTAVALIAHILRYNGKRVEVGGHMGRPALEMPALGEGEMYVLEISSYQLLSMETFRADVAVLLNIAPEHLERHGTMEAYQNAKKKIFNNQRPDDLRVISVDNYELEQMAIALGLNVPLRRISVTGVGADISVNADGHLLDYDTTPPRFITNLTAMDQLSGLHNWQNVTCAWAAIKGMVSKEQFVDALDNFKGVRHRYQLVLDQDGVRFVNDSKATTGRAAGRALANTQNAFWIAGGEAREDGLAEATGQMKNARAIYLIGAAAQAFEQELRAAKAKCPVHICKTLKAASEMAYKDARDFVQKHPRQKATVLLSPACNSFDQFYSFEHRGEAFITFAYALTGQKKPAEPEA